MRNQTAGKQDSAPAVYSFLACWNLAMFSTILLQKEGRPMKLNARVFLLVLVASLVVPAIYYAQQPENSLSNVKWIKGPAIASFEGIAEMSVPTGYVFANGADTRKIMEMMHNPPSGQEAGFIAPSDFNWFLVFEFDPVGYVKDDEKSSLDADALLNSIRKGTEAANQERAKRGWKPLNLVGWERPPFYDSVTHNLQWAIRCQTENGSVVNWNTRFLGRKGVMRVTLVADPAAMKSTMPEFGTLLAGYNFKQGQRYEQFSKGDKVAEYGLGALIVGGATAVAVKSGLFKWIWKILVVAALAVASFLRKLFSKKQ